jgi:hypothetical protein
MDNVSSHPPEIWNEAALMTVLRHMRDSLTEGCMHLARMDRLPFSLISPETGYQADYGVRYSRGAGTL